MVNIVALESAKQTLELVRKGSDYVVWQNAEAALTEVEKVGTAAITAAEKLVNDIPVSVASLALKAAKEALELIEKGTEALAFDAAKAVLEGIKLGSVGLLELADAIAKYAGQILNIRRVVMQSRLTEVLAGKLFQAEINLVLLGEEYTWNIDFDLSQPAVFIENLFHAALLENN